ncbi:unnamed protein product [Musa acuminata var. zebrina]
MVQEYKYYAVIKLYCIIFVKCAICSPSRLHRGNILFIFHPNQLACDDMVKEVSLHFQQVIASENHPVRWTTPIGLPVVQPYRKLENHLASFWQSQYVRTSLKVLTLKRETEKFFRSLSGDREQLFFPPNFVHSLDGSHMMMTAVACKRAGLNFAGVHDSYWTHACDVDQMNRILREKFVELYERPISEELLESCQQSFPTLNFPPLPERGDFDLQDILESPYSFN